MSKPKVINKAVRYEYLDEKPEEVLSALLCGYSSGCENKLKRCGLCRPVKVTVQFLKKLPKGR